MKTNIHFPALERLLFRELLSKKNRAYSSAQLLANRSGQGLVLEYQGFRMGDFIYANSDFIYLRLWWQPPQKSAKGPVVCVGRAAEIHCRSLYSIPLHWSSEVLGLQLSRRLIMGSSFAWPTMNGGYGYTLTIQYPFLDTYRGDE